MSIERLSNILVAAAAAVVIGVYALFAWQHSHENTSAASAQSYEIGETVEPLPALDYGASDRFLVAFIHSQCRFCTDSMPFYKALVDHRNRNTPGVPIVAVSREPQQAAQAYAASHHVSFDQFVSIGSNRTFKLHVTPTLLGIDSRGAVRAKWIGFLNESDQVHVRAWLEGKSSDTAAASHATPR